MEETPARPRRRQHLRPRRAGRRGQSASTMAEFALVVPVVLFLTFATIDVGRLIYTYNAIASAAREGARLVAVKAAEVSDCQALHRMESVGQAFPLVPDPNSVAGNSNPNSPAGSLQPTTPVNGGYIYIYPAVATQSPPDQNCASSVPRGICNGNSSGTGPTTDTSATGSAYHNCDVAVQIEYTFQPLTPLIANLFHGITLKTISVVHSEY